MPFQSEKQKKWMWANKPEMAREWTSKYGSKIEAKKGTMAKKDKNWIQKATKNMRKDKPCTGKKFGGPTCPPGTRRYNLAKTFRKMNKAATGTMVKADTGTWVIKKKWYNNPKKLEKMMTQLRGEYSLMRDSMAGKVSPTLIEKGKKLAKKKGFGWKGSKEKVLEKLIGDEAKGGPYKPGYKPQLSVRTAKKGTFSSIDTDRILAQMKVRHGGGLPKATKYKKYLTSLGKATSSRFPANVFTAGKTGLGDAQLKAHLKTKLPKGATSTLSKAARIAKATRYGKIALGVAAAGLAAKELIKHKSKKKVQKKSTGGEIIIGKGVDIDLL